MKKIAMIPGRLSSTRFPNKLLQDLRGKTVILRTYESAVHTGLFDDVYVVCEDQEIFDEIVRHGGKAKISTRPHESGSDRIAEAIADMDVDVIVNVQGDAPFIGRDSLRDLLAVFEGDEGRHVQVASLMMVLTAPEHIRNPNFVKVVTDTSNNSLLFSRNPIPYDRDGQGNVIYQKHIGVYAYRKDVLLEFTGWPMTPLESAEKIECLRYLEHGIPLRMVPTVYTGVEIDTPEDLQRALKFLDEQAGASPQA